MPNFLKYNYSQSAFIAINFEDQILPGTFEYTLHQLVEHHLDLSAFHKYYKNDEGGRAAYDPAIMLKIVLYAYSRGITSSREIDRQCKQNIIFKALSCDSEPHFTRIAAFISRHSTEITDIFEQILLVCDQQGLLGKELLAIDGCKMPSNASKEWSGTHKELENKRKKLRKQIRHHLHEHKKADLAGNDAEMVRSEQAMSTLESAYRKVDEFLKNNEPRIGQGKRPKEVKSNITDNESAKMTTSKGTIQGYNGIATVDKKHQIIVDAQAFGESQEHHTLQPILEATRERFNRLGIRKDIYKGRHKPIITADTGFANETNMQYLYEKKVDAFIPDNRFRQRDPRFQDQKAKYGKRHQKPKKDRGAEVIPATEFHFNPTDNSCVCPAGESLTFRGIRVNKVGNRVAYFNGRVTQCRNCPLNGKCLRDKSTTEGRYGRGRQVSFILEKGRVGNYTDWMKERVDSDYGKRIYSHRMSTVEPVFGNIAANKGLNRFSLRGKTKVQGQWQLFCMVHNIEKLANYGKLQ